MYTAGSRWKARVPATSLSRMRCRDTVEGARTDGDAETDRAEGGGGEVDDDQRARHVDLAAWARLRNHY
eukprot:scaffold129618_cov45-Phaeocystis_antarctica.AAC.1